MKKTEKQIQSEINQTEKELLENPEIDIQAKITLRQFRELCREFPEKINELKNFIKTKAK